MERAALGSPFLFLGWQVRLSVFERKSSREAAEEYSPGRKPRVRRGTAKLRRSERNVCLLWGSFDSAGPFASERACSAQDDKLPELPVVTSVSPVSSVVKNSLQVSPHPAFFP